MEIKLINKDQAKFNNAGQVVTDWFEKAILSAPAIFRHWQSEFLVAVPLYFQRIIMEENYRQHRTPVMDMLVEYYGWRIVQGYEDAIVFFHPKHSYDKKMIHKIHFTEANNFSVEFNDNEIINP